MSAAHDPAPVEEIRIGPIKVVELYTAPPPGDQSVADSLGTDNVPFDEVRHLISDKPLCRFDHAEAAG